MRETLIVYNNYCKHMECFCTVQKRCRPKALFQQYLFRGLLSELLRPALVWLLVAARGHAAPAAAVPDAAEVDAAAGGRGGAHVGGRGSSRGGGGGGGGGGRRGLRKKLEGRRGALQQLANLKRSIITFFLSMFQKKKCPGNFVPTTYVLISPKKVVFFSSNTKQ